jgi:N-acetylglucosaminyldiphosphoundecaprenol N-acetyl-beta-D-mannosaminyltransferase
MIWGVPLDDMSEDERNARLLHERGLVITPNPEILLAARQNDSYRAVLETACLSLPDGVATRFAVAAQYDHRGLRRHPGIDALTQIFTIAEQQNETLLIFGGFSSDHVAIETQLHAMHPRLRVQCIDPGMLDASVEILEDEMLRTIESFGPTLALVALGQGKGRVQGKQERIARHILDHCSNVRLAIGIGGSIDVLSGRVQRAPLWFRRIGIEWLWRLLHDPWRAKRIVRAVIVFPCCIAWDTLRERRLFRAIVSVTRDVIAHGIRVALMILVFRSHIV